MVGLSHFAVRKALFRFLPVGQRSLWPTEMLSSRRIPYELENGKPETYFYDRENGLCPQLLGNEEGFIRDSIQKLESWGAQAIDINMGCPVDRALKHNYGVSLMGDAGYAAQVTQMAVRHSHLPVSVKLRAGFEQTSHDELLRFIAGIYEAGASWITLHPRTAEQQRRGRADWELFAWVKKQLRLPLLLNGDVQCIEDMRRAFDTTACDRVVIGRAALGKPWLMAGPASDEPTSSEQLEMYRSFLLEVLDLLEAHYPVNIQMRKFYFLIYHGHVWLEYGHAFWTRAKNATTIAEARRVVREQLPRQRISQRTDLRG